ncbi:hypothetical protein F3Y22_tig00110893pilonHSYRG00836 [Hibiscus syriacus]|uniref:Uncharacterized protein n=1 Tax=Hibiscus syriacus TaxID=106335 RepID=A0A6A2ZGL4_HIBSY|nr:hypothetical protein F3Y22_tig00110893pilonHSYRG00836 [Hibiscus syriacus]
MTTKTMPSPALPQRRRPRFAGIGSRNARSRGMPLLVNGVEGCVEAIPSLFRTRRTMNSKRMLHSHQSTGDYCWPIIFPNHPYVPLFLKAVCKVVGNAARVEKAAVPPN